MVENIYCICGCWSVSGAAVITKSVGSGHMVEGLVKSISLQGEAALRLSSAEPAEREAAGASARASLLAL